MAHREAESAVKKFIGYDPEQKNNIEYFPRRLGNEVAISNRWDVNESHTAARIRRTSGIYNRTLQLQRLPVRNIVAIREDLNGRFGKGPSAFPGSSELTEGEDYWTEWDEDNLSLSGLVINQGAWGVTPGSIRVEYTAGYSIDELAGTATEDSTSSPFSNVGIDAGSISLAVKNEALRRFKTYAVQAKHSTLGWVAGPLASEKLGDYSYTLGGGPTTALLTGLVLGLTPESEAALESYVNWGFQRL
tara:strand:+ start:284 stop:1021 length:738 start_codon:yes stop_codon:yes gene_type:complete